MSNECKTECEVENIKIVKDNTTNIVNTYTLFNNVINNLLKYIWRIL